MKVAVLGAGMVGNAIALVLASRHHVTKLVGKHKQYFDFVLNYLKERKVNWEMKSR